MIKHKKEMKRCEAAYAAVSRLLLTTHIPYIIAACFITLIALLTQANEMILYFIEGVIKGAVLILSIYGLTEKEAKPSAASVLLILCDAAIMPLVVNNITYRYNLISMFVILDYPLAVIVIMAAIVNYIFGKKYHELEQYEGFPYFNGLAEKMKNRAEEQSRYSVKSYEEYRTMNSGADDDIDGAAPDLSANGLTGRTKVTMYEITGDIERDMTANGSTGGANGSMHGITENTERDMTANSAPTSQDGTEGDMTV